MPSSIALQPFLDNDCFSEEPDLVKEIDDTVSTTFSRLITAVQDRKILVYRSVLGPIDETDAYAGPCLSPLT
ncbi:hypothetical protein DL767_003440 [Monosporascus sp. MG133]|nr:hypothetical protein DL767_003440 [Monosporascus sp. MG133]